MEFSEHAVTRLRQRGFQELDLFLIANLGIAIKKPGNVTEYQMTQKVSKQIIQALDRVVHKAILMDEIEGKVVTAYNLNNR